MKKLNLKSSYYNLTALYLDSYANNPEGAKTSIPLFLDQLAPEYEIKRETLNLFEKHALGDRPFFIDSLYTMDSYDLYLKYLDPSNCNRANYYTALYHEKRWESAPDENAPDIYSKQYYLFHRNFSELEKFCSNDPLLNTLCRLEKLNFPAAMRSAEMAGNEGKYLYAIYQTDSRLFVQLLASPKFELDTPSLLEIGSLLSEHELDKTELMKIERFRYSGAPNPDFDSYLKNSNQILFEYALLVAYRRSVSFGAGHLIAELHRNYYASVTTAWYKRELLYLYAKSIEKKDRESANSYFKNLYREEQKDYLRAPLRTSLQNF